MISTHCRWLGAALFALTIACSASSLCAQVVGGPYKELPTEVRGWTKAIHSSQAAATKQVLLGNDALDAAKFEEFFRNVLFPQFTLVKENVFIENPADVKEHHTSRLPKMRDEFMKQFVLQAKQAKSQAAFEFLNKLTIEVMAQIALDNYHPLARYNAALMLSNIPDYASSKPAKEALPALLRCLDSTDIVRLAALGGILRQIESGNADDQRRKVQDALIKIALDSKPSPGDSVDGHNWVRRKAIEALVATNDPGAGQAVPKALASVIKDNQSSVELSCAAAKALGGFSLKGVVGLDPGAVAVNVGQVGLDALKAEFARAAELAAAAPIPGIQRANNSGIPTPGGLGGLGPAIGPPAAADGPYISIPLLQSQLAPLVIAFKGTRPSAGLNAASAGGKDEATVAAVNKGLNDLLAACELRTMNYERLKQQLEKAASGLETAVSKSAGQGRAPAGGKGDAAGDQFGEFPKNGPVKAER